MAGEQLPLREQSLRRYFVDATDLPFTYGECDCAPWVCAWIMKCGRGDAFAQYRGRYRTKLGRDRMLKREGGVLWMASLAFSKLGLQSLGDMASSVVPGDVGCLKSKAGEEVLAIAAFAGRWACKADPGVVMISDCRVLRAWRV